MALSTVERPRTQLIRPIDWVDLMRLPDRMFGELRDFPLSVEEFVADDHYVIRLDLPGIDPKRDVDISLGDGVLYIKAERRSEHKDKSGYASEVTYGSFARTLALPAHSTGKDVVAKYKDGVLEVRVPIEKAPERSRIPVHVS